MDKSWESLELFIRKKADISSKKPIKPDMSVVYDLGQEGDDADSFMNCFFDTFDVDEGDYDFRRYFFMEGEGLFYHLVKKYIFRKPHSLKREPLTVQMLYEAMTRGTWDSESLSLKCQQ